MRCSAKYGIDASRFGNFARFINHGCAPNLVAVKRLMKGLIHVFLIASRLIEAEEELFFDYAGERWFPCACGVLKEENVENAVDY
jgi:SET domain-containing protein